MPADDSTKNPDEPGDSGETPGPGADRSPLAREPAAETAAQPAAEPAAEPSAGTEPAHDADTVRQRRRRVSLALGAAVVVAAVVTAVAVGSGSGDDNTASEQQRSGTDSAADAADGDNAGQAPPAATGQKAVHQDEVLVTTDWLEDNLDNPDVVVIEVSENRPGSGLTSYEEGHVPGAVEFVWTEHFVQQDTRDIVTQEEFTELGQAAGINEDSTVVLYGDANNWFAAWGSWVFKLYGTEDVRLLDGGRVKWEAEGRPLDNIAPDPEPGDYQAAERDPEIRVFRDDVLEIATAEAPDAAPAHLG
ncbi:sulfurtransferase, partial [Streptomyces otsuchiensis]|uniref:sulfurtransferase n=1 Tax=Streptomyces otsuchiensis TaxID=2681388 RepID=UPI00223E0ACC